MFKHANTFFPNEVVSQVKGDGTKVAGHETGKVQKADPDSGKVKVAWQDGETWHDPSDLQKA